MSCPTMTCGIWMLMISNYIPIGDDVPVSDPLSKPGDSWTGATLSHCKFRKVETGEQKLFDGP